MNHGIFAVALLLLLHRSIQHANGQRAEIKSVYAASISDRTRGDPSNATTSTRGWGNIFAARRKGEGGSRDNRERGKGDMSKSSKESVSVDKITGKGNHFSKKGSHSPASYEGKGSKKRRSAPPTSAPSTTTASSAPSTTAASSAPSASIQTTAQPTGRRFQSLEPSKLPKQQEESVPTNIPVAVQCDDTFLAQLGLNDAECSESLYDRVRQIPDLSVTVALFELLNLTNLLQCAIGLTFVLPTNLAWEQIDNDIIGQLLSSRDILRNLFLYHILPEIALSSDLADGFRVTLFDKHDVLVGTNPLLFDNSFVVVADQTACGRRQIFHIVDQVLLPLLPRPPSQAPIQPPTFLPTTRIISTESPTGSPSNCTDFDFGSSASCSPNLLDEASQDPSLSLVVSLYEISGLQHIFDCPGPISAALPTNEAVIELGQATLDRLITSDQETLRKLLLYHLFPGRTLSSGLLPGLISTLSEAQTVVVGVNPVSFGGAEALSLDNSACNGGVYHKIGAVLDPSYRAPTLSPTKSPSSAPTIGIPIEIRVGRFYMSFVSDVGTEPTPNEYELLRAAIETYYLDRTKAELSISHPNAQLRDLSLRLAFTLQGIEAGMPRSRFNIYMEFSDAIFLFSNTSLGNLPTGDDLYNLLRDGVTRRFLLDVVRVFIDSPFAEVIEAAIRPL